jgi:hypothetical protein
LMAIFHQWMYRLQVYIDIGGEYVEWASFYNTKLSFISTGNRYAKRGVEHLVISTSGRNCIDPRQGNTAEGMTTALLTKSKLQWNIANEWLIAGFADDRNEGRDFWYPLDTGCPKRPADDSWLGI